jgi:hypothetical protein
MIDIEQGSLRAFKEHPLASADLLIEQHAGIGDVALQNFPEPTIALMNLLGNRAPFL